MLIYDIIPPQKAFSQLKKQMKRPRKALAFLGVLILLFLLICSFFSVSYIPQTKASPDWLTGWTYRKAITIDHTYIDDDLTNFPLYVKFTDDTDVGGHALANGYDIYFTTSDETTECKHERVSWSVAAGAASGEFYVLVPTVNGASNTTIYMYYGNATIEVDPSVPASVFDTTNGWVAAWHLEETAATYLDTTSNNCDSTSSTDPTRTTGVVGYGQDFNGSTHVITINNNTLDIAQTQTFECWINPDTRDLTEIALGKYYSANSLGKNTVGLGSFSLTSKPNNVWTNYEGGAPTASTWHHVAIGYDGISVHFFTDGVAQTPLAGTGDLMDYTAQWQIGASGNGASFFAGLIDEVRISNVLRSDAWMKFTYRNIIETDNEITLGPELIDTDAEINIKYNSTNIASGGTYDFGSKTVGTNTDVIFTIENLGVEDNLLLNGSPIIALGGTNPNQFSVQVQPSTPVTPSGNTTFTIRFSPTGRGAKSATISISNNDLDESIYSITFTGTGTGATSFYVDATNGSDSWTGTFSEPQGSPATDGPWKTLSKVNASNASYEGGDFILFKRGETWSVGTNAALRITKTGLTDYLTFGAYGTGAKPHIIHDGSSDGMGPVSDYNIANVEYIKVENIQTTLTGGVGAAIHFTSAGNASHIVIDACDINSSTGSGIGLRHVNTYRVENCVLNSISVAGIYVGGSSTNKATNGIIQNNEVYVVGANSDGITIHDDDDGNTWGDNHQILNNLIDNTFHGENCIDVVAGTVGDRPSNVLIKGNKCYNAPLPLIQVDRHDDCVIEKNFLSGSMRMGILVGRGMNNVDVRYNIVTKTDYSALETSDAADVAATNVRVYNNSFKSYVSTARAAIRIYTDGVDGIIFKNNAISWVNGQAFVIYMGTATPANTNSVWDYNLFYVPEGDSNKWTVGGSSYNFTTWQSTFSQDANSILGDPLFLNAGGSYALDTDFQIPQNSPALDAGTDVGLTTDYAGDTVPKCSGPDIGAYEYQQTCPIIATTGGGLPGGYSDPPIPGPNGFKITINNNDTYTNSRDVTLTLEVGGNVKYLVVSEKKDFSDTGFEAFEPEVFTKKFTLSEGNGSKRVYAQFATAYNRFSEVVYDDIILDTTATKQGEEPKSSEKAKTPESPETAIIIDGDLIRAINTFDVYVLKLIPSAGSGQAKKFKRLILNPDIFNRYKHLKWENVKDVSQETIDQYPTSTLARALGDTKVYKFYPNGDIGEKRWIKTLEDFLSFGYDWDSVYTINNYERDSYSTGPDLLGE